VEVGVGVGRGASADCAERVAVLELSWAKQKGQEIPSKRMSVNEKTCRIINDSTSFTIEIPLPRDIVHRTKNRCVLANTAAGK
jgi:hypothetical protein